MPHFIMKSIVLLEWCPKESFLLLKIFAIIEMAPRRAPVDRGLNINEGGQVPHDNGPENEEVPNEVPVLDVNAALAQMANAITMQAGRNMTTPASRIRDFTRMNPPVFYGSKVEEDPQEFIDQVLKVVTIMGVTCVEKAELAAYQIKRLLKNGMHNGWRLVLVLVL